MLTALHNTTHPELDIFFPHTVWINWWATIWSSHWTFSNKGYSNKMTASSIVCSSTMNGKYEKKENYGTTDGWKMVCLSSTRVQFYMYSNNIKTSSLQFKMQHVGKWAMTLFKLQNRPPKCFDMWMPVNPYSVWLQVIRWTWQKNHNCRRWFYLNTCKNHDNLELWFWLQKTVDKMVGLLKLTDTDTYYR